MSDQWTAMVVGGNEALRAALASAGAKLLTAANVPDAISQLLEASADVAVVEVEPPGEAGLAVLQ
ncbi:MAG: hypothetical protein ACO1OB_12135, partial [Archangium sp.]